MTTSQEPFIVGPYWDYPRLLDYLREQRNNYAVLCTRAFLSGDNELATFYAERFEIIDAKKNRVNDRYDRVHDRLERWIGYDVQQGRDC